MARLMVLRLRIGTKRIRQVLRERDLRDLPAAELVRFKELFGLSRTFEDPAGLARLASKLLSLAAMGRPNPKPKLPSLKEVLTPADKRGTNG